MKLDNVTNDHNWRAKFKLMVFRAVGGTPPDIVRLLLYRPEFFGRPMCTYIDRVLRGDSSFSVGERELLAAWVSSLNNCEFCYGSHRALATKALGKAVVDEAFADFETSSLSEPTRGAMAFVKKLVTQPGDFDSVDVVNGAARGLTDEAMEELVHITTIFCTINMLADSLGFKVPTASAFARMSGPLLKHGYKLA